MTNRGTFGEPWNLSTALSNPDGVMGADKYGHTLHLRKGVYVRDFVSQSTLFGSLKIPILVEPYENEKPRIDGSLFCRGQYVEFRNLEIANDDFLVRQSKQTGSNPTDIPTLPGVKAMEGGEGIKFINCVIHDCAQGVFAGSDAQDVEFYGCVIYYNGWVAPDRGHGHGAYIQNKTGGVTVRDCIIFSQFGYGVHAYGETGQYLDNIVVEGCTCFGNGVLSGTPYNNVLVGGYQTVAHNPVLRNNMTFGAAGMNIGYQGGATGVVLENNYCPDGIVKVSVSASSDVGNYAGLSVGNQVFVRPNRYQSDRANISIYNESRLKEVHVDLSSVVGLNAGDRVWVRNVQDYFNDIQVIQLDKNKSISIDMRPERRTVAKPQGWNSPATTFPMFGAFVVEKNTLEFRVQINILMRNPVNV